MLSTYDGISNSRIHTNIEKYQIRRSKKYAKHSNWHLHNDPPPAKKWKPPTSFSARMKYLLRADASVESLKSRKSNTNREKDKDMPKTVQIMEEKDEE